jgi:hypothetical protein
MSTPRTKEPTKKAFHFPKSAKEPATETKKPAAKASQTSEAKKASTVEQAPVSAPEAASASPKTAKATKTASAAGTVKAAKSAKTEKAVKPAGSASPASNAKPAANAKEKVVRDSFTMPKSDYAKIAELKQRCLDAGLSVKKSELLRAGLNLLAVSPAKRLIAAVQELEAVKTGRPAKS